jgi:hypothetical protein
MLLTAGVIFSVSNFPQAVISLRAIYLVGLFDILLIYKPKLYLKYFLGFMYLIMVEYGRYIFTTDLHYYILPRAAKFK